MIDCTRIVGFILAFFVTVAGAEAPTALLQLEAEPVAMKYCMGDGEISMLHLHLRLQFRNTSPQPVILNRSALVKDVAVGKSEANGRVSDIELRFANTYYSDNHEQSYTESWPNPAFILLKQGQTYLSYEMVSIPVKIDTRATLPGIGTGRHYVQFVASTWVESNELAERLRAAWRSKGYLWTDPVWSKPAQLVVSATPKFENCE